MKNDITLLIALAKSTLLDLSKQQKALGEGLQNAAPANTVKPNNSVQYLLENSAYQLKLVEELQQILSDSI